MKSIKNHLSLVVALLSILFSMQIFIVVERSIEAYKENLANNYSMVIVSQRKLSSTDIQEISSLISKIDELSPDNVITRLDNKMDAKNREFLKLTLPKFYKLGLDHYPTPYEITSLKKNLLKNKYITKVYFDINYCHRRCI